MVASNTSCFTQKQLNKNLERVLEEAHLSGKLKLCGQKLKEFTVADSTDNLKQYNLRDTVFADLSKNRFMELPEILLEFIHLEKLYLCHNTIKTVPKTISLLQSLVYLDISRNHLTALPREICHLPLQTLLVAHNRIALLPEELGRMSVLVEFDAGNNLIKTLPSNLKDLLRLKYLNLRSNLLGHIPIELTHLKLIKLDVSQNRISNLPHELKEMKSLIDLKLSDNPLIFPPAALCLRGRLHIFKYLEFSISKHQDQFDGTSEMHQHSFIQDYLHLKSGTDFIRENFFPQNIDNTVFFNVDSIMENNGLETLDHLVPKCLLLPKPNWTNPSINSSKNQDCVLSIFLFTLFISTLAFLYVYPVPA